MQGCPSKMVGQMGQIGHNGVCSRFNPGTMILVPILQSLRRADETSPSRHRPKGRNHMWDRCAVTGGFWVLYMLDQDVERWAVPTYFSSMPHVAETFICSSCKLNDNGPKNSYTMCQI